MRQAGYANGMYTGPQVTMVADNTPPGSNTAQVVAADLAKIGFDVKTISVTHSTMYTRFCNVPKNEPNICPNVGWLPDFHEPQTILDVTFNGKSITPVNNSNWPLLNDPKINAAMARAERSSTRSARYAAWGKIDQQVTRTAAAIPWLWENYPTLFSTHVTPAPELWNGGCAGRDVHGGHLVVACARRRHSPPTPPSPGVPAPGDGSAGVGCPARSRSLVLVDAALRRAPRRSGARSCSSSSAR